MELIELRDICKTYHLGEVDLPVLKGISLRVARGELVALMGASGSGKSTLMHLLGCLDHPSSGQYWLDSREISGLSATERARVRNRTIGFVFQSFNLLARTSALENVMMPLSYAAEPLTDRQMKERATGLLKRVGLADRMDHQPSQLSGGQQQRVAIARSLVNTPQILLADEPTGNLDSRTSEEILRMFQDLNLREGLTVILVTHDPEVARHAQRIIRIKDGLIEDGATAPAGAGRKRGGTGRSPDMKSLRTLKLALRALRRNIMRAALTTLGIVIGVAAVIAMMEIGNGSSAAIQRTIASMGANNLIIMPGTAASGGVSFGAGSVKTLTPEDARAIGKECPAVASVAPVERVRTQVVYGNRNWVPLFIYGTTPDYLQVRDWTDLAEGDTFTDRDVRNASKVCLVGQTIVRELFGGQSPVGQELRIQNVAFKVIGVLQRKGANMMGMDQDDVVLAPWTTIKYRVAGSSVENVNQSAATANTASTAVNTLSQIYPGKASPYPTPSATQQADTPLPVRFTSVDQIIVAARSGSQIPMAIQQIVTLLHERHHIHPGEPDDFSIRDMTEMTKAMSSTTDLMTKLLLAVAMISLVVGGVGIMNIMLVSVTERTREIGLRMAVGAKPGDILRQFLAEAVVLCLIGGAMGILVGRGSSFLVQLVLNWPTVISIGAIVAAVLVSATVGIVFGYYPAWKASRLDPIEALRYE